MQREALRAAIEARTAASTAVENAEAALSRCNHLIAGARTELASIGNVDGEMAVRTAARIAINADGDLLELPEDLAQRRTAGEAVRTRIKALDAARGELEAAAADAARKLHAASRVVDIAAQAVLIEAGDVIAARIHSARAEIAEGFDSLSALSRVFVRSVGGGLEPLRISRAALNELELALLGSGDHHARAGLQIGQAPNWLHIHASLLRGDAEDAALPK